MWHFKDKNVMKLYNKSNVARTIGLAPPTLLRIVAGKQDCSKLVAYCITKTLNADAEIEDYFERVR
jgi:DNA-binding XRE family transcriptional regulator